jgi:hypothetical protein
VTSRITEYAVAADSLGAVHLIWRDQSNGPNEIGYVRWDGQAWSPVETIISSRNYLGELALAVEDSGRVHVVWVTLSAPSYVREVHYRCRDAAGWSPELTLTTPSARAWTPVIAADGDGRVHVVWEDNRPPGDRSLYAMHQLQGQWTPEERLLRLPGLEMPLEANLAVDARGTAHLAWSDNRNDYRDVYYRRWSPNTGWSPHERVTSHPTDATSPALAVDRSGNAHLVWCDSRDGNREIYYMQRPPDEPWEPVNPGDGKNPTVQCLPNPFKTETAIHAFLPSAGDWAVHIFDLQGRLVYTYRVTASQAGDQILTWGGRMDDDQVLSRGVYFVRLSGNGRAAFTRAVLSPP